MSKRNLKLVHNKDNDWSEDELRTIRNEVRVMPVGVSFEKFAKNLSNEKGILRHKTREQIQGKVIEIFQTFYRRII